MQLPALTGLFSNGAEATAAGLNPSGGSRLEEALTSGERRTLSRQSTLLGSIYLQPFGGVVDAGASNAAPRSNGRTWRYSCRGSNFSQRLKELLQKGRSATSRSDKANSPEELRTLLTIPSGVLTNDGFSESTYTGDDFQPSDCSAVAIVNDSNRGTRRDLLVLLLGGALGIAGTLLVEALLQALHIRHFKPSAERLERGQDPS